MPRGATLNQPLVETVLLTQRILTIALSGHNALYFATYRSSSGRRRLGAVVLAAINLAIGAESVAFGVLVHTIGRSDGRLAVGSQLIAASLSLAVAAIVALLILRQRTRKP